MRSEQINFHIQNESVRSVKRSLGAGSILLIMLAMQLDRVFIAAWFLDGLYNYLLLKT